MVRRRIKKKLFSADYSCNDRVMPVILMMTLLEGCLTCYEQWWWGSQQEWSQLSKSKNALVIKACRPNIWQHHAKLPNGFITGWNVIQGLLNLIQREGECSASIHWIIMRPFHHMRFTWLSFLVKMPIRLRGRDAIEMSFLEEKKRWTLFKAYCNDDKLMVFSICCQINS